MHEVTVDQEIDQADEVRAALDYDPATGVLTWRHRAGALATLEHSIRRHTRRLPDAPSQYELPADQSLNGRKLFGHRLAFLMMTGAMPHEVDHRDMNGLNNRWENLRPCTRSQNKMNRGWQRNAKIETKGVSHTHTGRRYRARIKIMGKERHLGCFDTPEEAHVVYMAAAREHFGEFVHA